TLVDGSGMSRYNLVSPHHLVSLLRWVFDYSATEKSATENKKDSLYTTLLKNLPVAGIDGTLKYRMKDKLVRTRVRAKTGYLGGIITVSGYIATPDHDVLAFAVMINGFVGA